MLKFVNNNLLFTEENAKVKKTTANNPQNTFDFNELQMKKLSF